MREAEDGTGEAMFESIKVPQVKGMSVDGTQAAGTRKPGEMLSEKLRDGMSRVTLETIEKDFKREASTTTGHEERLRKLDSSYMESVNLSEISSS